MNLKEINKVMIGGSEISKIMNNNNIVWEKNISMPLYLSGTEGVGWRLWQEDSSYGTIRKQPTYVEANGFNAGHTSMTTTSKVDITKFKNIYVETDRGNGNFDITTYSGLHYISVFVASGNSITIFLTQQSPHTSYGSSYPNFYYLLSNYGKIVKIYKVILS